MNNLQKFMNWITSTLREAALAPVSVLLLYGIGFFGGWYDRYPPLDMPTHLLGGLAITYFYRSAIRNSQQYLGAIPAPIQILFAFTATGTTTVLWEFLENVSDYFLATQHVRGLRDTLTDLFMGLLGALLLSILYKRRLSQ